MRTRGKPVRAGLCATAAVFAAACSGGGHRVAIQQVELPAEPSGDIPVAVTLVSSDSTAVNVALAVSQDQTTWTDATLVAGSATSGLATSPDGVRHVFTWDSVTDLGFRLTGDTWIRITATGEGGLVEIQTAKLARIANLLPAAKRVRHYIIHSGPLDAAKIRIAETHDLVILWGADPSITRAAVADIQNGVDASDPRDDVIVLGYLDIGEDERTIGRTDTQLLADARFVGNGSGPRIDPRGPGAAGQSLAGIDLAGLPAVSGGFAPWYLDDNSVEVDGVGDGKPDRDSNTGACYVNAGDPDWFNVVHDMTTASDGLPGIRELLATNYGRGLGFDGLYLDNVDTCAPNSWTGPGDPGHASFEWTAPGVTSFCAELRRRYPETVLMQNRGLFFFDARRPHYHFSTGPFLDFVMIENYRLDRDPTRQFDPYAFAEQKYNLVPRLQAEAQRFTFQVVSLGYAEGPGIDQATLTGGSTVGLQTLLDDVTEADLAGFRHYLTNAGADLINSFARNHTNLTDTTPPVWSSTYNVNGMLNPPGAPFARVGIQQLVTAPGATTVRWDVALDQNAVTYFLYYTTSTMTFDSNGFPRNATVQQLYPARVPDNYGNGALIGTYPFEATSTGLTAGKRYWFCIFARDTAGNWAKNQVVLNGVVQ